MTWIVKATGGYEYNCHPDGDIYGPDLSDAYRYTKREKAARVAAWLNRTMKDGLPYRVVRLRRAGDRLRDATADMAEELLMQINSLQDNHRVWPANSLAESIRGIASIAVRLSSNVRKIRDRAGSRGIR